MGNFTASVTPLEKATIEDLNRVMLESIIPVVVFIALLALLGFVGNLVVVWIYSRNYPTCNFKYFVLILAAIDLTSCVVLMPLEIVTFTHWFLFPSAGLCKFKSALNVFTVTASASSLLLIAIDRFRKVCKPHSPQISPRLALKLTVLVLALSSIPAASDGVFWGLHTIEVNYKGTSITATLCEKDDMYKNTPWPNVHTMVLYSGTNVVVIGATLILYVLIAKKLFCSPGPVLTPEIKITSPDEGATETVAFRFESRSQGEGTRNTLQSASDLETGLTDSDTSYQTDARASDEVVLEKVKSETISSAADNTNDCPKNTSMSVKKTLRISQEVEENKIKEGTLHLPVSEVTLRSNSCHKEHVPRSSTDKRYSSIKNRLNRRRSTIRSLKGNMGTKLRRKTLIMFILTIIFVVTTLTYLIMISYMSGPSNNVNTFTAGERTAWLFFLRLYFINSFINPLLYGFLDTRFRRKLWDMGIRVRFLAGSLKRSAATSVRGSNNETTKHNAVVSTKPKRPKSSNIDSD